MTPILIAFFAGCVLTMAPALWFVSRISIASDLLDAEWSAKADATEKELVRLRSIHAQARFCIEVYAKALEACESQSAIERTATGAAERTLATLSVTNAAYQTHIDLLAHGLRTGTLAEPGADCPSCVVLLWTAAGDVLGAFRGGQEAIVEMGVKMEAARLQHLADADGWAAVVAGLRADLQATATERNMLAARLARRDQPRADRGRFATANATQNPARAPSNQGSGG